MKTGWRNTTIGNILRLEYGKPLPDAERIDDGLYPLFGANGEKGRTNRCYYDRPSIIVGRKGSAGELNLTDGGFWPLDVTYFVKLTDEVDLRFVWYLLTRLNLPSFAKGVKPGINRNEVYAIPVQVPGLREQERIVAILDEAFEGIATAKANAEKNLQNARDIFDHHLEAVFNRNESGWARKSVSELAEHSLGKMLDKQKNRGDLKPYLRNVNVRWFDFDLSDVSEMRFLPDESDKYRVSAGDVVVCEGGYPGRAAIWNEDAPMFFQKALHRVRFHEPAHSKWFLLYLYSQSGNGRLKQHFTGSGIQHFTGAALGRFIVPIAPKKQIIELLQVMEELQEQVRILEAIYQKKIATLETLKQSLLHQAFTGKL